MERSPSGDPDGTARTGAGRTARQRILDAAERLFAERGYDATTTKAVSDQAGVATGLVFYHFTSKAELLASLLRERSFGPELEALLETADREDVRGTLETIGVRLYNLLSRRRHMVRIMLQMTAGGSDADGVSSELPSLLRAELDRLGDWLDDALGRRTTSPLRGRVLSQSLMSTMLTTVALVGLPDGVAAENFVADVVDVLLDGAAAGAPA